MRTLPGAPQRLSGIQGLAKALTLPHEFPAGRFPTFPQIERSSVLAAELSFPMTVNAPSGTVGTRALLWRQPSWPMLVDQSLQFVNVLGYRYDVSTVGTVATTGATNASGRYTHAVTQTGTASVSYPLATYSVTSNLSGRPPWSFGSGVDQALIMGRYLGNNYVYVPAAADGTVRLFLMGVFWNQANTITTFGASGLITLEYWVDPTTTLEYVHSVPATGCTALNTTSMYWFSATVSSGMVPGFWRVKGVEFTSTSVFAGGAPPGGLDIYIGGTSGISSVSTAGNVITLNMGSAATVLTPPAPPPGFTISTAPYNDTRVTALAALFTNVTKALNKEGTVNAARLAPGNAPLNFTISDLTSVHPFERAYMGLEKGFYTYVPPTTDMGSWADAVGTIAKSDGAVLTAPAFDLSLNSLMHAISFNDPDGGTALAVSLDWHLEFRSVSVLWPIDFSRITLEEMHQAMMAMNTTGFFFDNPDHKSLLAMALRIASSLSPYTAAAYQVGKFAYDAIQAANTAPAASTLQADLPPVRRIVAVKKQTRVRRPQKPKPKTQAKAGKKKGRATQ